MWKISTSRAYFVFIKHNPGASTSNECDAQGYTRLESDVDFDVTLDTATDTSSTHRLAALLSPLRDSYDASINDYRDFFLVVSADGNCVFEKLLLDLPTDIRGPADLRTDNGSFIFKYYAD